MRAARVLQIFCALILFCTTARADPVEDFYKGRQVRLIIGANTGGSYDLYGRLLAAHLGRHIPGNPTIVPSNMTGASGIQATNYMFKLAPKDGSTIGMLNQSMGQRQMLEPDAIRFDMSAFHWLGGMTTTANVLITWYLSGVKTLEDARHKQVVVGALSADGGNFVYPMLLNRFAGTRFKVVTGYPGGNTIQIAMERGEVDARGSMAWSGLKAGWPQWIAEKKVNVLVQVGLEREPDLPDVPLMIDVATTPLQKAVMHFVSADSAMGFPTVVPPEVPPERVAALRAAVAATLADPVFLADARKRDLPIRPIAGDVVQKVVASLIATPKDVIETLKRSVEEAKASMGK